MRWTKTAAPNGLLGCWERTWNSTQPIHARNAYTVLLASTSQSIASQLNEFTTVSSPTMAILGERIELRLPIPMLKLRHCFQLFPVCLLQQHNQALRHQPACVIALPLVARHASIILDSNSPISAFICFITKRSTIRLHRRASVKCCLSQCV